jgi:hypothetical protein
MVKGKFVEEDKSVVSAQSQASDEGPDVEEVYVPLEERDPHLYKSLADPDYARGYVEGMLERVDVLMEEHAELTSLRQQVEQYEAMLRDNQLAINKGEMRILHRQNGFVIERYAGFGEWDTAKELFETALDAYATLVTTLDQKDSTDTTESDV